MQLLWISIFSSAKWWKWFQSCGVSTTQTISLSPLFHSILTIPIKNIRKEITFSLPAKLLGKCIFFIMPLEILKGFTSSCDNSLRPSVGKPWIIPSSGVGLISAACQQPSRYRETHKNERPACCLCQWCTCQLPAPIKLRCLQQPTKILK